MLAALEDEDELLAKIDTVARLNGWRMFHVRDSKRGVIQGPGCEGFPDLVLVKAGRILYRELKREGKDLEPPQVAWRDALVMAGADWALWRPSDWRLIEATLKG